MPNYFTVTPDNQTGDVYATDFVFNTELPAEFTSIAWSLGSDTYEYNKSQVTKTYDYPGVYAIGLSAWTDDGTILTESTNINVDYVYRDILDFRQLPSQNGTPGVPTNDPFKLYVLSSKIDSPISVTFQAFNTKSVPHYAVPEKWRFITPTWKFLDASTDQILDGPVLINTVPIYKNSKVVAVSGEASIYYVDSLATGHSETDCPLLLTATLSTENFSYPPESLRYPYYGYSNSEVARAVIAWQINDVIPTKLKITENYLNNVFPTKWSGVPIPVMITCQFDPIILDEFDNAITQTTDVLAYPRTNELGETNPVKIVLSADSGLISEDLYTVEVQTANGQLSSFRASEAPLYFKAFDQFENSTSGYIFTTVTPLTSFGENVSITLAVSTVAANQTEGTINSFPFPDGYPIYPDVYLSHPLKSVINKVNITTYPTTCDSVIYYKSLGLLVEGAASSLPVPTNTTFLSSNYFLSDMAGVYGMAFDPIKNKLYAADADLDRIYVYDEGTTLTDTIYLSSITNNDYNVPSYISIDKNSNFWISLYSNEYLLKFDSDLNLLLSAIPAINTGLSAYGSMLISPPIVETDKESNVWACYAHELSSMLIKFDGTTGQQILSAENFALSSVPVSLAIDVHNNVWVACQSSNSIKLYSGTTGTLMETLTGIYRPSYIALDRPGNLWITHGYDFCSVYDTVAQTIKHWKFNSNPPTVTEVNGYTQADIDYTLYNNEIWGGLAIDVYNRVWAVDSEYNALYVFNIEDPVGTFRTFTVFPDATTNYVVLGGTNYITEITEVQQVRSAQAGGDWTGNRWYQKYAGNYSTFGVRGISTPFKIYDIDNSYTIAKVNEEFDYAEYMKSLALPEILSQNEKMFDEFIAALVGDGNPTKESLGRVAYERIANFVQTHGDFETSEIDQLLSFAQQLSVPARTYGDGFPTEINRLLSLFSIPKHKLRGQIAYDSDISNNIGPILDESSYITAGQYIFVKDRRYDTYQLVSVAPLSSGNLLIDIENEEGILTFDGYSIELPSLAITYQLSSIQIDGLRTPLFDNYYFFEYNEEQIGYKGSIINWDSDFTTIDYTLSSYEDWYGDNGLVETMFNNILTKRLIIDN